MQVYKQRPWILRRKELNDGLGTIVTKEVVVSLRLGLVDWNSDKQRLLVFALAAFLGLSPEEVEITSVREGSVKLTVRLPALTVGALVRGFSAGNPDLLSLLGPLPVDQILHRRALLDFATLLSIKSLGADIGIERDAGLYNFVAGLQRRKYPLSSRIKQSAQDLMDLVVTEAGVSVICNAVSAGLAPRVVENIVRLPLIWRSAADQLRTLLPEESTAEQKVIVDDYCEAADILARELEDLLNSISSESLETSSRAATSKRQSRALIHAFIGMWKTLFGQEPVTLNLEELFKPLPEDFLNEVTSTTKLKPSSANPGAPPDANRAPRVRRR